MKQYKGYNSYRWKAIRRTCYKLCVFHALQQLPNIHLNITRLNWKKHLGKKHSSSDLKENYLYDSTQIVLNTYKFLNELIIPVYIKWKSFCLKLIKSRLTVWGRCILSYFPRIYDTIIYSINWTTQHTLVSENSWLSNWTLAHFFIMLPFPLLLGPGCCRESSQTSRSGERRDGRGTCKCFFWKVGIDWMTHKAINMLLNIARLPGWPVPTAIQAWQHNMHVWPVSWSAFLFFVNYRQFLIVSDTFISSEP